MQPYQSAHHVVRPDKVNMTEDDLCRVLSFPQHSPEAVSNAENEDWWETSSSRSADGSDKESWSDIVKVLYGSLRASSSAISSIGFENLAFGW